MSDATLGIVIDSSGAQKATVDLDKFAASAGKAESAATKMGGSASSVAERDLGKMSEVLGVLEARATGMASNFGIMGSLLTVMGPEGIAAAAGVGAIVVAIDKMIESANRMGELAQSLTNIADTAGITTTQLQGLQIAGDRVGISSEMMTQSLDMFTVSVEQLRQGTGPLYTELSKISPTLVSQLSATKDTTTAWNLLAQAYHNADQEQKNIIARSASGGRNGIAVGRVLDSTATAGGMNGLVDGLNQADILTQQQVQQWNDLKIEIDEASTLAKNNFASIFTSEVLEDEKQFYDTLLDISRTLKEWSGNGVFTAIANAFRMASAIPGMNNVHAPTAASKINDMVGPVPAYPPATSGLDAPAPGPTAQVTAAQAAALVSALGSGATVADKLTASLKKLDAENANNAFGTQGSTEAINNFNRAVSAVNLDAAIQQIGLYVGALGPLATISDMVTQKMDQVAKAQQQGAGLTGAQVAAIQKYTYETQLGITAIDKSADSYTIQAATVDMATGKAASYAAVMAKVYENIRLGHPLTQQQTADLLASADAMGKQAQAAERANVNSSINFGRQTAFLTPEDVQIAQQLKGLYGNDVPAALASSEAQAIRLNNAFAGLANTAQDALHGFATDMRTQLQAGATAWQAFETAGSNALNKIADKLMNMAIDNLWGKAFGGGGGLLGLLGIGGSGSGTGFQGATGDAGNFQWASANGNVFAGRGISAYSGQIVSSPTLFSAGNGPMKFADGAGLMGEAGPEAVMPLTRTKNGKLGVATSSGSQPTVVNVAPQYVFNNADPNVEARLRQQIAQSAADTQQKTVAAVQKLSQNSPGNYLPPKR